MKYFLSNIPFFITLGILGLTLGIIFLSPLTSPEHKKSLKDSFIFCLTLCAMTLVADICFFFTPFVEGTRNFAALHGYFWGNFVAVTSNIFALLAFTGLFMFLGAVPFCGKLLHWFVWCVLTIPTRMYYLVTGIMPNPQDILNLFGVKPQTAFDTITTFLSAENIIAACLPNIIVIVVMCLIFRKRCTESFRGSKLAVGILIFAAYCVNPKGDSVLRDSMGYSLRLLRGAAVSCANYFIPREKFAANSLRSAPADNIVLILDESIRGDYLSINNPDINTTPRLAKYVQDYPDNLFNYGLMMSTATTSFASRIALMTALTNIPSEKQEEYKNPTILDIAKANGYKTILMNVQGDLPDMVFRAADVEEADENYLNGSEFVSLTDNRIDFKAADFLRKRLTEEHGLFIFLEKIGTHVPYQKRYPVDDPAQNIFEPCLQLDEFYSVPKRMQIINSYKNALRYNIDGFFAHLFGENPMSFKDCTIIYTSDHGQSFMEYGQLESHSTTYLEQTLVPFLIFSTDEWVLGRLRKPSDVSCTLHHLNIVPTLRSVLCRDEDYDSGVYSSLVYSGEFRKPELRYILRGAPSNCELSDVISSDSDGKIILPTEKYMY